MPDLWFGHTRKQTTRLLTDAFDVWHCDPEALYVAIMRLVDIKRMEKQRSNWYHEHDLAQPFEAEGAD